MESKTLLFSLPLLLIALFALAWVWRALKDEHRHQSGDKPQGDKHHVCSRMK